MPPHNGGYVLHWNIWKSFFFFLFQLSLWFVWKSSKGTELCRSKSYPDAVSVACCCISVRSQIKSLSLHYFLLVSLLQTKLKALGMFFFDTRILGKTHSWALNREDPYLCFHAWQREAAVGNRSISVLCPCWYRWEGRKKQAFEHRDPCTSCCKYRNCFVQQDTNKKSKEDNIQYVFLFHP